MLPVVTTNNTPKRCVRLERRRVDPDSLTAQQATYANRRRIRGERGKERLRQRGELVERSFAHTLESGAMRRTWLRHHDNILKRYLVHVAAFNFGLVMRQMFGFGTPRGLAGLAGLAHALNHLLRALFRLVRIQIDRLPIDPATRTVRARITFSLGSPPSGASLSTAC